MDDPILCSPKIFLRCLNPFRYNQGWKGGGRGKSKSQTRKLSKNEGTAQTQGSVMPLAFLPQSLSSVCT